MKHYGDITKLSGYTLPIVDVITGGSPCQDLSVAGKRAGLAGERSGLFMEQMRIVKEMRERDVRDFGRTGFLVRPRYMVWENVPGAFSSGKPKGSDFQAVLEEIVRVVCEEAPPVPIPKEGWPKAGCISGVGDSGCTFSIAWRVHDAQFWGVPQRRKRIALVADFGGLSAPEILFERKGLSGDPEPCGAARKETAGAIGSGAGSAISFQERAGKPGGGKGLLIQQECAGALAGYNQCVLAYGIDQQGGKGGANYTEDVCPPILSDSHGTPHAVAYGVGCDVYNQEITGDVAASLTAACGGTNTSGAKVMSIGYQEEVSPTLRGGEGGNQKPCVYDARGNGNGEIAPTMTGDHQNRVTDYTALCVGNGQLNQMSMAEQANTLDTMHDQQAVMVAAVDCRNGTENPYTNGTLQSKENGGQSINYQNTVRFGSIVRRLTPLECERLQGYPDGWTDIGEWVDSKGKKHKDADSPRYKALGNSIALPFWQYLARRICAQYERSITMASLFDGIGGFPLVFERCGAKAVWASEIEEFPIAVTKRHFPEE